MGTVTSEELLKAWKLEQIQVEMAIGHILQNLVNQQTALELYNRTLFNLRADMDRVLAHADLPPNAKSKPKPS